MKFLANLWAAILKALGLCTIKELESAITETKDEDWATFQKQRENYEAQHKKDLELIDELREAARRYRDEVPTENLETIKSLEAQLHEVYQHSLNFGFPRSIPSPGSVSMYDLTVAHEDQLYYNARLRMILTDDETSRVNQEPDQAKRIKIVDQILEQRGMYTRIGRRMVMGGASPVTLAYNSDCTNFEVYAECAARIMPNAKTIVVKTFLDKEE